jgi:hypothetical protein
MKKLQGAWGLWQGARAGRVICAPLAPRRSPLFVRYLRSSAFICGFFLIAGGCADSKSQPATQPMTVKQRQDAMLQDPMGYNPQKEKFDISGGKINEFDKGAFKRDVDNVLNP